MDFDSKESTTNADDVETLIKIMKHVFEIHQQIMTKLIISIDMIYLQEYNVELHKKAEILLEEIKVLIDQL